MGYLGGTAVVVSGGADGKLRVGDVNTGKELCKAFQAHRRGVNSVVVSELKSRPLIISGGVDGTVRTWDVANGAWNLRLSIDVGSEVNCLAVVNRTALIIGASMGLMAVGFRSQ